MFASGGWGTPKTPQKSFKLESLLWPNENGRTLNVTVLKVDNLVWLPRARKRENWSRGPTVDDFCAGTHRCRPKSRGPTDDPRGPRDDLRLMVRTFLKVYMELGSYVSARTNKRHHHHQEGGCQRVSTNHPCQSNCFRQSKTSTDEHAPQRRSCAVSARTSSKEPMQVVWRVGHLPAPSPKETMQGVRGGGHLPAPAHQEQVQGVPR